MVQINTNYLKLKAGYLFPEIGRRVAEAGVRHLDETGYRIAGKLHWLNVTPPPGVSLTKFLLGAPFNIWMGVIGGTVQVLSSHGAEQLIVQRVLACKSVADGRKALVLSAIVIFPLFLIFLLVGAMLWVFYQGHPFQIALPETSPGSGITANDFIFPIFMMTEVPHLLKGFLIVAILSAAMSSVSSALTSLASVSTMDFVKHLLPGRSEGFFLRFSKVSTVFWAAALILTAYLSRQVAFVLNAAFALRALEAAKTAGADVLCLCDTNGGVLPSRLAEIFSEVRQRFDGVLGIHTHNDSGTAVASTLAAVERGATHVQGCMNGYGERCGTANLGTVIGAAGAGQDLHPAAGEAGQPHLGGALRGRTGQFAAPGERTVRRP